MGGQLPPPQLEFIERDYPLKSIKSHHFAAHPQSRLPVAAVPSEALQLLPAPHPAPTTSLLGPSPRFSLAK